MAEDTRVSSKVLKIAAQLYSLDIYMVVGFLQIKVF